jgi:F420-dependent oxidoreductase-like protein
MKLSILFPEVSNVERAIQRIVRLDELGFHSAVMGHAFGFDPISVFALAGQRTERILLTTAVVPTYGRHPIAMAMGAATAQAASNGRFRLGIGPSHQPIVEHVYGLSYDKPVRHMIEYLTVVRDLLQRGETSYKGEVFQVQVQHRVDGGDGVPVMMSALGQQMCRAAGRASDGVIPWLAPAAYVKDTIVPAVNVGAEKAGRNPPPIIAETACLLSSDADEVVETVRREMGFYLAMPAYRALFERANVPGADTAATEGWTREMVDDVIAWGDADRLASAVESYFAAGADEVVLSPVGLGSDPDASYERTLEVLSELARSR